MTWYYNYNPFTNPESYWGFVYVIEDLNNKMFYLGKKQFYFKKYKVVKGKRKKYLVDSDWQDYYGSNTTLQEQVQLHGTDQFKRIILHLCMSKSECSYYEAKLQFQHDVLLKPNWYNNWISVKVTRLHLGKLSSQD